MSLFSKLEAALTEKATILAARDGLATQVADLTKQLTELTETGTEAGTRLEALTSDLASAKATVDKLTGDLNAANAAKTAAEDKLKNPSAAALEIAAKAGVAPNNRPAAEANPVNPGHPEKKELKGLAKVKAAFEAKQTN